MAFCFQESTGTCELSVFELNRELTGLDVPGSINESVIEYFLDGLELCDMKEQPVYWLMMARLTETALLCAGNYADNCEFTAAGDLLINPRKIVVHEHKSRKSWVKKRHGRLSDQFNTKSVPLDMIGSSRLPEHSLEVVKPALLPYMIEQLEDSRRIPPRHIHNVKALMGKIVDTMGFLRAGSLESMEALHHLLGKGSTKEQAFIQANLCRFDSRIFDRLGEEIELLEASGHISGFMSSGTTPFSDSMASRHRY